MPLYPISAASSHPEPRSTDPQRPLGRASPVPSTQGEQILSLDSSARRVKASRGLTRKPSRRDVLTSRRSRKGIFHLPVPLRTRAPQVSGSEAGHALKRGARGIPAHGEFLFGPGTLHQWCSGKSQGGAALDQGGPLRSSARPLRPKPASRTAIPRIQCNPSLGEGVRGTSSSYRTLAIRLPKSLHPNLQGFRSLS